MHVVAGVLLALALLLGVRFTGDLEWPGDPDNLRDIAHAQTILDGAPLADPAYAGEYAWYNPLVPAVLATVSLVSGQPVHRVHVRGGAYFNLLTPAAFYGLVWALAGPSAALIALSVFLFANTEASWLTASYAPSLFSANFSEGLFYLSLLAYARADRRRTTRAFAAVGLMAGLTLLGHSAAALLMAAIVATHMAWRLGVERGSRAAALRDGLTMALVAVVVGMPLLWPVVVHYRLEIRNPVPFTWLDPLLVVDQSTVFLDGYLQRIWRTGAMLAGVVALLVRFPGHSAPAGVLLLLWLGWSATLLFLIGYVPQLDIGLQWLSARFVPPHHFLVYLRAVETALVGCGVWALLWGGTKYLRRGATVRAVAALLVVTGVVAWHWPLQAARHDFGGLRHSAQQVYADESSRRVYQWLRAEASPDAVFLTAENSGLSIVAASGRKTVAVPSFFSNPYVSYQVRDEARRALWLHLEAGRCTPFLEGARVYRLSHVLAIAGSTPLPEDGTCGLELAFEAGAYRVLVVAR
jgi:hypothetical protein